MSVNVWVFSRNSYYQTMYSVPIKFLLYIDTEKMGIFLTSNANNANKTILFSKKFIIALN